MSPKPEGVVVVVVVGGCVVEVEDVDVVVVPGAGVQPNAASCRSISAICGASTPA